MLFQEIMDVYYKNHTTYIHCAVKNVITDGTYSYIIVTTVLFKGRNATA
jgi:hypothetical protein